MNSLIQAAEEVLSQGRELLGTLTDREYARKSAGVFSASVGEHYRHVLEHFHCLLEGLPVQHINYDRRARDRHIEVDRGYAMAMTDILLHELRQIPAPVFQDEITVSYSVGYQGSKPEMMWTTVAREVAFCVGHAVHHYAIIRMLCAEMGARLSSEFGLAPSTIKYQAAAAQ